LRIHFTTSLTNLEREAALTILTFDITKAAEGDSYTISGDSFHDNSSSLDGGCSGHRWKLDYISSNSPINASFDDKSSSRLENGLKNLILD
jgi:hypothetical protein